MSYCVVIPARYASTRLPGKPLLDIHGQPMIWHVMQRALESKANRVIIATDDDRIADAVRSFDAEVVMTSPDHPSGTDRLEEVARVLGLDDEQIIVNVQGDEPLIPAALIDTVAHNLATTKRAGVATLCEPISDLETLFNPNAVKVVFDEHGMAMYFSRAPIPWFRDAFSDFTPSTLWNGKEAEKKGFPSMHSLLPEDLFYYRHIGMYAYRCSFLKQYVSWSPSMHERSESLEQLRAISNGVKIHVQAIDEAPAPGVDTEQDLIRVRNILAATD